MEYLFTEELLNKLPTLEHYKQLCYSLSVRGPPYNSLNIDLINAITTIEDIQIYMFNTFSSKSAFFNNAILNLIDYAKVYRFYIAPNTYTNKLTLKQFFHCINVKYFTNGSKQLKCSYKYNLFYTGVKYDNHVYEYDIYSQPIDKKFISSYFIGITEGEGDNSFKNLPIEHFELLLKIIGTEYSSGHSSYEKDYICKYWEDKDIELYLDYIVKNKISINGHGLINANIKKNKYTQEKLSLLYEKYCKLENSTIVGSPLYCYYVNITRELKIYINTEPIPVVRLGFDEVATTSENIIQSKPPQLNKLAPSQTKKEYDAPSNILFQENINKLSEYKNIIESLQEENKNLQEENKIYQESSELYFTKCEKLKLENAELQQICDSYAMANIELQKICDELKKENSILQERTKILDESNF